MTDQPDAASWTIPADQVQTVSINPPPVITINGTDGQPMVSIHPEGRIEYGPDYQPDEAARAFWDAIQRWYPGTGQATTGDGEGEGECTCPELHGGPAHPECPTHGDPDVLAQHPAPEPGLREQVAALFRCPPGGVRLGDEPPGIIADAVLAVRGQRMEQLRKEVKRLGLMVDEYSTGASGLSDKLARLRESLPVLRRALESLPATCRYHGDQLDPDRFGRMTRSEACCDTGIPARRRREAENALTMLDQPKED